MIKEGERVNGKQNIIRRKPIGIYTTMVGKHGLGTRSRVREKVKQKKKKKRIERKEWNTEPVLNE